MTAPPDKPLAGAETDSQADLPERAVAAQVDEDVSLDPRMYSKWRARPWRVSHMMILVAAVALMLWIAVLAAGILVIAFLIFSGFLLFVFTLAMGTGVILARRSSTRQDSLLWLLAIAAETQHANGPRGRSVRRAV